MNNKKLIYLTKNQGKVEEANRFFRDKYGFDVQILDPRFEVLEIQAKTSDEVVKFSVKYAADRLGFGCLKSDTAVYMECLGGLPGPYNAYFDKQIGAEKFLELIKNETNRKARLQHSFAYCEPGGEPVLFDGGSTGALATECRGTRGRWHDLFFVPDGETKTLSELREIDPHYEAKFWGMAIDDFAAWYAKKIAA
jgi:non-canonical purine NTP pyrophosphatase (RdgB/HAM1 family)